MSIREQVDRFTKDFIEKHRKEICTSYKQFGYRSFDETIERLLTKAIEHGVQFGLEHAHHVED